MIPKYDEMYKEVLLVLQDGKEHSMKDVREKVANILKLSDEDLKEKLESGINKFASRINWSCVYLKKARLIESSKRGFVKITENGKKALISSENINNSYLYKFEEFREFIGRKISKLNSEVSIEIEDDTPQDKIEQSFEIINKLLEEEILEEVLKRNSDFFEVLVVKLLQKIGYGGFDIKSGIVTQRSNDGGIDGTIREDKLGFDMIYIQAKKWEKDSSIGRQELQKFVGALAGKGASKGLFITTGKFSEGAKKYSKEQKTVTIVLIDGKELAKLMIEYDLGVSVENIYKLKRIDGDFFNEIL